LFDKEVFEKFFNTKVQIINDENFVITGRITGVYDGSISVFTDGKTVYLSFERVKEIRPLGGLIK